MSEYLLDTNVLSDLVRNPRGIIREKIAEVGEDAIATSIIVAAELRYGAAKRASMRLTHQVDLILSRVTILPFDRPMDKAYGEIRVQLERTGRMIGGNDLLIAAQAKINNLCLVTANLREFERVADLKTENWLTS